MIAAPEVRRSGHPRLARLVQVVFWPTLVVVLSLLVGVLALQFSEYATRWLAYALIGLLLAAVTVVVDLRKALLTYCVLGLSVDVHYYLTQPLQVLHVGNSGPTAISIPLSIIPAIGLLAHQAYLAYFGVSRFRWGPELGKPAIAVIVTTALATAVSSMRFFGLCVVVQLLWFYVVYLTICNAVRTHEDAIFVVRLLLLVLFIQCLVFFAQIVTGVKFSAVGQIHQSGDHGQNIWHSATGTAAITTAGFATFIEPITMVAFALWRAGRTEVSRSWTLLVALLGLVVTVLTLNRSSWIAILLGLSTVEILLRARGLTAGRNPGWRLLALLGGLGLLFTVGLSLLESKRHQDHESDYDQRLDLMKPATRMIVSNPFFGVGPGTYGYSLRQYSWGWRGWLYVVHNDYLLIWAERGTIGFVAFLFWLRAGLRMARDTSRSRVSPYGALGAGVLGGLVIHMWETSWSSNMSYPVYGILWLLLGLLVASREFIGRPVATESIAEAAA